MANDFLTTLAPRFGLLSMLLPLTLALGACGGEMGDLGDLEGDVDEAEQAVGPTGGNNLAPAAIDADPLKRSVTDAHGITSSSNADPLALCISNTVTSTGCVMQSQWENWLSADSANRIHIMRGIAKCAVSSSFSIRDSAGANSFAGQWELYPGWKTNRLTGQDKRERVSACILTLLNGNNAELELCILGPGGAPFNTACSDSTLNLREGGFFGDLFAENPTAYVAGPDSADPVLSGRACFASQGTYCCAESDTNCAHRIVLAGAILGSPGQNYANKRCNGSLVSVGGNQYCTSFFSTREPSRSYTNVFTTFVPSAP